MLVLFLFRSESLIKHLERKYCVKHLSSFNPVLHPFCFRVDDPDELRDLQADPWDAGQKSKKHQEAHQLNSQRNI